MANSEFHGFPLTFQMYYKIPFLAFTGFLNICQPNHMKKRVEANTLKEYSISRQRANAQC